MPADAAKNLTTLFERELLIVGDRKGAARLEKFLSPLKFRYLKPNENMEKYRDGYSFVEIRFAPEH